MTVISGLIKQGKAEDAMHEIGGLETSHKNSFGFYSNEKNLKGAVRKLAEPRKADLGLMELPPNEIQSSFKAIAKACLEIPGKLHVWPSRPRTCSRRTLKRIQSRRPRIPFI